MKSLYLPGQTISITGGIKSSVNVTDATISIKIYDSDDILQTTLYDGTVSLVAGVRKTYTQIAGGALSWSTEDEGTYYIKVVISGGTPSISLEDSSEIFTVKSFITGDVPTEPVISATCATSAGDVLITVDADDSVETVYTYIMFREWGVEEDYEHLTDDEGDRIYVTGDGSETVPISDLTIGKTYEFVAYSTDTAGRSSGFSNAVIHTVHSALFSDTYDTQYFINEDGATLSNLTQNIFNAAAEVVDKYGFKVWYFPYDEDTYDPDKIFGEDADVDYDEQYLLKMWFKPTMEVGIVDSFGRYFNEQIILEVDKNSFRTVTCMDEPRVKDWLKINYNGLFYRIDDVAEEDSIFKGKKPYFTIVASIRKVSGETITAPEATVTTGSDYSDEDDIELEVDTLTEVASGSENVEIKDYDENSPWSEEW